LSTGNTAHDSSRKTQQMTLTVAIQLATVPIVEKLSGYTQSVMGHGRQQSIEPEIAWHSRPSTSRSPINGLIQRYGMYSHLQPPVPKRLASMNGAGQRLIPVRLVMMRGSMSKCVLLQVVSSFVFPGVCLQYSFSLFF
jgi:hypothetical protein